jgi:hypothetical protein
MIVIISQYFYPSHASTSQLMTDLANGLADRNYDVRVYTGTSSSSLEFDKIQITRSPDPFQPSIGKLVNSLLFS